nr:mitochondrial import inner membrane translocase subunit Tim8 B isoform X1 [Globicephala melas]
MSLGKAQGHPATRKQSYDNIHPQRRKKTRKRKTPGEPEVGIGSVPPHMRTQLVGRSRARRRQWRSWVRRMKRSCSAWWRRNSRRRSSLHRSRAHRQNARPL